MEKNATMVSAVSLILVVGVALGVVAFVSTGDEEPIAAAGDSTGKLTTHAKAVQAVCQNSDDKEFCSDTFSSVNTSDPTAYVKTVVKKATQDVIKAFNLSDTLTVENTKGNSSIKMALDDCKDLLEFAIDELEASQLIVQENNINNINARAADLKNWIGAVVAYKESCLDGFDTDGEKEVQSKLKTESLDSVGKLTALALDVVSGFAEILSDFNLDLITKTSSRRLLDVDQEGYPSWLSMPDRKLLADTASVKPNVVVAKDGSGDYKSVEEAINSYPKNHQGRYIIYVKAGTYDEYIKVDKKKARLLIYGDGPTKSIITGNKNVVDGYKTIRTATFSTVAEDFIAKSIAFVNTAGAAKHQAVALRVQGDRSAFFDCAMHGYQDTLYTHAHRQFYRNCEISGTVDFIFGYGTTLIQNSRIIVRKPDPNQQNIVVADGTDQKNMPTGAVLQNCEIVAEPELEQVKTSFKSYLARPWKAYSRAIFLENTITDVIQADGFLPWNGDLNLDTCFFAEYENTGPGADVKARVKWSKGVLTKDDATKYTADQWLQANAWLPATGIPYTPGFNKA
ncbi:pectinesterase-like [Vigna unguiculata]|uniref:Pectinesterase n=1 Tax=Vigna unguiculata TaxID=3917 RepID=A0A4D6N2T0_VIGUN|nr:pectinesterase-like [Vigna unguiculata]QCE07151.1 pectinesterase [Vigna unguiculata]